MMRWRYFVTHTGIVDADDEQAAEDAARETARITPADDVELEEMTDNAD